MAGLDLHIHSRASADGQYGPAELVELAAGRGIRTMAVADHNTARAVAETAALAGRAGIGFIPAIELDCFFEGVWLHVLGYWIDPQSPGLSAVEESVIEREQVLGEVKLAAYEKLGLVLDRDRIHRLAPNGVIWGETVAEVVLADPRNRSHPLLAPYFPGGRRSDNPLLHFDWDFCSPGRPVHYPVEYISLSEAVAVIGEAGGVAFLAHPGRDVKEEAGLLKKIAAQGLAGLEAFSSYHSVEQTRFYRDQGRKLGLALSCGSDFHGRTKPNIRIGSVECGDEQGVLNALRALRPGEAAR